MVSYKIKHLVDTELGLFISICHLLRTDFVMQQKQDGFAFVVLQCADSRAEDGAASHPHSFLLSWEHKTLLFAMTAGVSAAVFSMCMSSRLTQWQ